jgi:hypothetical protein
MPEAGEGPPRIIIDPHGTTKEVPPLGASQEKSEQAGATVGAEPETTPPASESGQTKEGSKPKSEKGKSGGESFGEKVGKAFGRAAEAVVILDEAAEGVEKLRSVIGKGRKGRSKAPPAETQREPSGPTPTGGEKKETPEDLTFTEIIRRLENPETDKDERSYLEALKKRAIEDVAGLERGEYLNRLTEIIKERLPYTSWNGKDSVVTLFTDLATNWDRQLTDSGGKTYWKGLIPQAMGSELAKLRMAGIIQRDSAPGHQEWRREHGYSNERIQSLVDLAKKDHVYDLLPENAEVIVASRLESGQTTPGLAGEAEQPAGPTDYARRTAEATETAAEQSKQPGFLGELQKAIRTMKKESEDRPEAWAKVILEGIDFAEANSETEKQRSNEVGEYWGAVERAIQEMPSGIGNTDRTSSLALYLSGEYRNGLTFKDRLTLLFAARKHLNDRYVEVSRAGGSLTKMGVGSGEVPFEGITYKVQQINPEDFQILYHMQESFPELSAMTEISELLPNLDISSVAWMEAGIKDTSIPVRLMTNDEQRVVQVVLANRDRIVRHYQAKLQSGDIERDEFDRKLKEINTMNIDSHWLNFDVFIEPLTRGQAPVLNRDDIITYASIPTFDNSLNNASTKAELRRRMADLLGRKSEDLSFRILTSCLTIEMFDRNRTSTQGSSDPRDLMWIDRKRVYELGKKEREPGLDWTVGRYFVSRPDPGATIDRKEVEHSEKLQKRRDMLEINAERGILIEKSDYFEGEIVSDFFHNTLVFVPDVLKPGKQIRRNLATYVINGDGSVRVGGFKNMPFLQMGPESYSIAGYWGYTFGKANSLVQEISSTTYKKADEELVVDDWWNKRRDLFARLEHISPRLIAAEFKARGEDIRARLVAEGGFNSDELKKISGYSDPSDLDVISDPGRRQAARAVIEASGSQIAKAAKERAERLQNLVIDKFRLVHALGVVWPGSIDAGRSTSTIFGSSTISEDLLNKIIRAITASRYLEGEYLNQFKIECSEMGFGSVMAGRTPRYRLNVNSALWD